MKPTSHDLIRATVARHCLTRDEIRQRMVDGAHGFDPVPNDAGAGAAVDSFLAGGPASMVVAGAIIDLVVEQERGPHRRDA